MAVAGLVALVVASVLLLRTAPRHHPLLRLATSSHWLACLDDHGTRLSLASSPEERPETVKRVRQSLPSGPWAAVLPVLDRDGRAVSIAALRHDGFWWEPQGVSVPYGQAGRGIPLPVRDGFVREVGRQRFAVLLAGGRPDPEDGHLREAHVLLVALSRGRAHLVWDGFDLALRPWLVRPGRRGSQCVVLVGVYKPTRMDPVVRRRPFLYGLATDPPKLRPLWLVTFLGRPFEDAALADLTGDARDELIALEVGESGRSALAAYTWKSLGLERIANNDDIGLALPHLRVGHVSGRPLAVVAVREGQAARCHLFARSGERIVSLATSRPLARLPGEWALVPWSPEPALVLLQRGRASFVALQPEN